MTQKKSAFTLAETIMTLFIVGLVITASIPMFTRKTSDMTVANTPWSYCQEEFGLCGIYQADGTTLTSPSNVLIGGGVASPGYDLTVNTGKANSTMYDIFKSDSRVYEINNFDFIEDKTNLYITQDKSLIRENGNGNVIIGTNNRTTGINNALVNNNTNNIILGNSNTFTQTIPTAGYPQVHYTFNNDLIIGNNNTIRRNNTVVIGNSFNSETNPDKVLIGLGGGTDTASPTLRIGKQISMTGVLNIGNDIYINETASSFYTKFNGSVTLNGILNTNSITYVSDGRLKNIKSSYTKGLNEVKQLKPVVFKYKGATAENIGIIAQEIQPIFPESVVKMPNGYLAVNNDAIFFAMLNSLKEINTKAELEKQRQEKLEKELKELKSDIESMTACNATGFLSKIKCFLFEIKIFAKSLIGYQSEVTYEKA